MSISQLEVNLEQKGKTGVVLPYTEFIEPRLPVRGWTRLDALPPYDPEAAASTAGQSLRSILTTIERARVRYVGIEATDARDVVFLNQMIRAQCPDVRVFTTEPSVALLHPKDAPRMRGMVVASTYPLAPIAQYWARTPDSGDPGMIPFPTQSSQGYYNAILAQFGCHDLMLGYRPPRIPGVSGRFDRPPIWISVVGHGGRLVPVHCYTDYEPDAGRHPELISADKLVPSGKPNNADRDCEHSPRPCFGIPVGVLLGSLGSMGVLAAVISVLLSRTLWHKWAAGLSPEEAKRVSKRAMPFEGRLRDIGEPNPDLEKRFQPLQSTPSIWVWRGVMLAGILLFALPYTLPAREMIGSSCCGMPCGTQSWRHWFVFSAALVITAEVLVVAGLLLERARKVLRPDYPKESLRGYVALFLITVLASAFTWIWWVDTSPLERFFLYVRATDLTAGISPVIPMGLVGAAAFAFGLFSLNQADLARRPWVSFPDRTPWSRVYRTDGNLRRDLDNPFRPDWDAKGLGVTTTLGIAFVLYATWNAFIIPLPSAEGVAWDWTMRGVLWLAIGSVVVALGRFLTAWSRLQELLQEILQLPMVGAFERLPAEVSRVFRGYLLSCRPELRHLATAAWALPEDEREELAKAIRFERPRLAWVFGRPVPDPGAGRRAAKEDDDPDDPIDRMWLGCWLEHLAAAFLVQLPGYWSKRSATEAFGVAPPAAESPESATREPHPTARHARRAEEFVAVFVVLFLGQYFAQLKLLIKAAGGAALLLLFAAASYPFQPDRPLLLPLVGLLSATAVGTLYVHYRINTNGLVSRITNTTPDRFTPDMGFFSSVTTQVMPLVVLVVLQLLGLFRFIVEPVLGLLG